MDLISYTGNWLTLIILGLITEKPSVRIFILPGSVRRISCAPPDVGPGQLYNVLESGRRYHGKKLKSTDTVYEEE